MCKIRKRPSDKWLILYKTKSCVLQVYFFDFHWQFDGVDYHSTRSVRVGDSWRRRYNPEEPKYTRARKRYKESLEQALLAGQLILQNGGKALDAVEAAVRVLEDNPLFNAGKGAVFTNQGKNELDAAIMDGRNLAAGAIAGVTTIRNPITAARAVMEKSEHVMLSGIGAEQFAKEKGIELVDPSYFHTPQRWRSLERARQRDSLERLKNQSSLLQSRRPWNVEKKSTVQLVQWHWINTVILQLRPAQGYDQ